jgi:ABC-type nickel/cobalt efflux system permease component RcnA
MSNDTLIASGTLRERERRVLVINCGLEDLYMYKKWHRYRIRFISFVGALLLAIAFAIPAQAHWADLAVAEVIVGETQTAMTLTFPTGLVASADDDRDGRLSSVEVGKHQQELQATLGDRIRLTDANNQNGILTVRASDPANLPPNLKAQGNTHSTLLLTYSWQQPIQDLKIDYNLFLPGVPTARCVATIFYKGKVQNSIFSPENRQFALMPRSTELMAGGLLMAIAGAFVWGAAHAMSPGHGKTIVGAYLVGSQATPKHALFLGLTATITHTIGVFALGLVTLFASRYILAEQLTPWLSLLSGLLVAAIGINLLKERFPHLPLFKKSPWEHSREHHHHGEHSHEHHHHHGEHPHEHHHHHHGEHSHEHHHHHHGEHSREHHQHHHDREESGTLALAFAPTADSHHIDGYHSHDGGPAHSHLPPGADGSPVTWRNLLALGISGGLVPCPSALVLLLSAIAIGQIGSGLMLVFAFSLGLAATLTGLGLLLVSSKRLFDRLPARVRWLKGLPIVSAILITLLGLGISIQAIWQIRPI